MFEIPLASTVKLDNAQGRMEHHGETLVPAVDVSLTWRTSNRVLETLMPGLREVLFAKDTTDPDNVVDAELDDEDDDKEEQGELSLPVDELSVIRFRYLAYPLKVTMEGVGYRLQVAWGLDNDIVLHGCKVSKIRVTPIAGGSVEISLHVSSAKDIDADVSGRLLMMQQQDVSVGLLKPIVAASAADDNAERAAQDNQAAFESASAFQRSVEEAFLAGGTVIPTTGEPA